MDIPYRQLIKGDKVIWIILFLLSLLSMLIVYSSTGALAYREMKGFTIVYLLKQMIFLGLGFAIMIILVNAIPVKMYSLIAKWMVFISIGLLILTLGLKFAHVIGRTGRTLFFFQPAEVAKISLIALTAKILGKKQKTDRELFLAFREIIFYTSVICGLILFSNFSTAALLFMTIMAMMFIGRIPVLYLLSTLLAAVAFVVLIYFTADFLPKKLGRVHTTKGRLERFVKGDPNSEKGITQADYAKLAIYEGGIIGKGPGHSDVRNYMAAAFSDFIFAIIVEEYGLIIGAGVILLYLIFLFRCIIIIRKSNRTFPAFLVAGLGMNLVFQAMINIGVSSGILPVTGQPLPWISLGGTALLFTSVSFGIIISVSYQNQIDQKIEKQPIEVNAPDEDYEIGK